jgi:hypothetical protein
LLLAKKTMQGSSSASFADQKRMAEAQGWAVPTLMGMVVSIVMHHRETAEFIHFDHQFSCVQEVNLVGCQIIIGGLHDKGIRGIRMHAPSGYKSALIGIVCARISVNREKLPPNKDSQPLIHQPLQNHEIEWCRVS